MHKNCKKKKWFVSNKFNQSRTNVKTIKNQVYFFNMNEN